MDLGNNFVITETDQTTNKCTAMLLNYSYHRRKLSVGQSITSQTFEMTLPQIGKSTWTLVLFPNGQYEFERDNGQLSVYLKMIACECENEQVIVDVKFFLDSEEKFTKVLLSSTFQYQNTRTRWVGAKLVNKSELVTHGSCGYLIKNNNLIIGFRLIYPVVLNDDFQSISISNTSKEVQSMQTTSWTSKAIYSNSSVIDMYRPTENSSSPSSIHSRSDATSNGLNGTTTSQSVSNESS